MTDNDDKPKKVRGSKQSELTADQRLLRKREAARIRQQRCRARKKEALMQKRLAEATGKQGEELKEELAKIKAAAAATTTTPKKKDDAEESKAPGMPMQFPFVMGPFGPMMPPGAFMHPMMMQQQMAQFPPGKNPMECPPDVMGLPAKGPHGEDVKSPEKKIEEEEEVVDDENEVKATASV